MFQRRVSVEYAAADGVLRPCPVAWIDNFAMRNFTNDALFDDTLPAGDGVLEVGNRVPLERLQAAMEDWFRRKGYLKASDALRIALLGEAPHPSPPVPFGSKYSKETI